MLRKHTQNSSQISLFTIIIKQRLDVQLIFKLCFATDEMIHSPAFYVGVQQPVGSQRLLSEVPHVYVKRVAHDKDESSGGVIRVQHKVTPQ